MIFAHNNPHLWVQTPFMPFWFNNVVIKSVKEYKCNQPRNNCCELSKPIKYCSTYQSLPLFCFKLRKSRTPKPNSI